VNSRTSDQFWKLYRALPLAARVQARVSYGMFAENPQHPSLQFKSIHPTKPFVSVRVGAHYRVVGVLDSENVIWFWIGSHEAYNKLISRI
jgi:hypothetical protein